MTAPQARARGPGQKRRRPDAKNRVREPSILGNTRNSRPALCHNDLQPRPVKTTRERVAQGSTATTGPTGADDQERQDRRSRRYLLREVNWEVSPIRRCQWCGRIPGCKAGGAKGLPEIRAVEGEEGDTCYWTGTARCGSVWACPVCSAKIRHERALEVDAGMRRWLEEENEENSVFFLTLTLPHDFGEPCKAIVDTIRKAWSSVFSGRPYKHDRERFAIVHSFRAWDATHGKNGWHPHLHAVLFVKGHLGRTSITELEDSIYTRWARAVTARGHRAPSRDHGIRLEEATRPGALAGYLLKVSGDETGTNVAMELTRGDLKTGPGRTPFQILQDFKDTGDLADLELFQEWVRATKGIQFSRWSTGARKALSVDELDDQDLVEKEVGGVVVFRPQAEEWHALTRTPGALCEALEIAEKGGADAVATYVSGLRRRWRSRRRCRSWSKAA